METSDTFNDKIMRGETMPNLLEASKPWTDEADESPRTRKVTPRKESLTLRIDKADLAQIEALQVAWERELQARHLPQTATKNGTALHALRIGLQAWANELNPGPPVA